MIPTPPQPPTKPPIITVWIHGTKINECLPSPFAKLAKNLAPIVFDHKDGLNHSSTFNPHHYEAIRANALGTTAPTQFHPQHLYSFGWSGKLNIDARKKASQTLFSSLKQLVISTREAYNCDPEIILISHSHGGNVILHLGEIVDPDGFELVITKAILLACPVQKHTAHLICSPVFKRIYSLHSHTDMIQIADLQGLHIRRKITKPFFSQRHFNTHPRLIQVAIRWKNCPLLHPQDRIVNEIIMKNLTKSINIISYIKKNRGLFHIEFQLLPFIRQLPAIICRLDQLFETYSNCPSHKDHDLVMEL